MKGKIVKILKVKRGDHYKMIPIGEPEEEPKPDLEKIRRYQSMKSTLQSKLKWEK